MYLEKWKLISFLLIIFLQLDIHLKNVPRRIEKLSVVRKLSWHAEFVYDMFQLIRMIYTGVYLFTYGNEN